MKEPTPQPRRRDAAVLIAAMLGAATLWFTVLGPMSGGVSWRTLLAVLGILLVMRLATPAIYKLSRWVSGKGKSSKNAAGRRP
ncbi:MAG: hypothetical protein DWQ01_02800 [Planctomycetota bacterium]|nr:MAG: hypothetical protein DWQ01_02800 [Planctomycetota bacterium]